MSISKISAMQAEAEVLGAPRKVQFQEGQGLQIVGLTYAEAMEVLRRVSDGVVREPAADLPDPAHG